MKIYHIVTKITFILLWLGCFLVSHTSAQTNPSCFVPGNTIINDDTSILILPQLDIEQVSVAEPIFSDGSNRIVFSMKVQHLHPLPLGSWNVFFSSGGVTRFVQMSTLLGSPQFRYGTVSSLLGIPTFNYQGNIQGSYNENGTISFYIEKNRIGNPAPGHVYSITSRVYVNTLGIGLVEVDNTDTAAYTLVGNSGCSPTLVAAWGVNGDVPVPENYNRNETDDFAVWRPSTGVWYSHDALSQDTTQMQWGSGAHGDIPVPGHYDFDGYADFAVYRPSDGNWYVYKTETSSATVINFGLEEDIPLSADYDGDRVDDLALFRPSTGVWYILSSLDGSVRTMQFGLSEDRPVSGDFDGDRRADIAVFRPSTGTWYIWQSDSETLRALNFGVGTDIALPADYDGDEKTDIAVWRPESGTWFVLKSDSNEVVPFSWGATNDIPVPGDYNGNGRADFAVFRPSNGVWYAYHN
jgi:hypothetical protein